MAHLAVPVAVQPVNDARALGTELERHRGEVSRGLRHDNATDAATTCTTPKKRVHSAAYAGTVSQ